MEQKTLYKKIYQFLADSLKFALGDFIHFTFCSACICSVVLSFLLYNCTPYPSSQKTSFHGALGKSKVILFVDSPYKIVEKFWDNTQQYDAEWKVNDRWAPFYRWILEGMVNAEVAIIDDKTVLQYALAAGIYPAVLYKDNNPNGKITHFSFDDAQPSQMSQLFRIANELGVTYLMKARLVATEAKIEHRSATYQADPGVVMTVPGFLRLTQWEVFTATIEFTVWSVERRKILLTREFTSTESAGFPHADVYVQDNIANALIASILSSLKADLNPISKEISVSKSQTLEFRYSQNGQTFINYRSVMLKSVKLISSNLLQFDFNIYDSPSHDDKLTFRLRLTNNKLATYMDDDIGIRHYAESSSLMRNEMQIRPGESKDFSLVFQAVSIAAKSSNLHLLCDVNVSYGNYNFDLEFKDIPLH